MSNPFGNGSGNPFAGLSKKNINRESPTGKFPVDIGHNIPNRYVLSKDGCFFDKLEDCKLSPEESLELLNRLNDFMFDIMMKYAFVCARLALTKPKQDSRESLCLEQYERDRARYIEVIHGNDKSAKY